MTTKEKLAIEYINLKKQFEGDNFKENLTDNQIWYLTKRFRIADFKRKIEAIKKDIDDKDMQLKKEAYFLTPEGQDYKKKIEDLVTNYRADWKKIRDDFAIKKWIVNKDICPSLLDYQRQNAPQYDYASITDLSSVVGKIKNIYF